MISGLESLHELLRGLNNCAARATQTGGGETEIVMDSETLKKVAILGGTAFALTIGYYWCNTSKESKPKDVENNATTTTVPLPKVGDGTELADYAKALLLFGDRCVEEGKGAGFVDVFGSKKLFLTDPEMARKVLGHSVQHALWGGITSASEAFFGENVLFVLEGAQWRFLRNVMKHSLMHQNVLLMTKDVAQVAHSFTQKLTLNKFIDFNELMGLYHLAAIGKSAFNYDMNCLSDNLGPTAISKSFEFFIDELPRRALNPDQTVDGDYKTKNAQNTKWKKAAELVRSTIAKIVEERLVSVGLKGNQPDSPDSIVKIKVGKNRAESRSDLLNSMIFANLEEVCKEGSESKEDEKNEEIQITRAQIDEVMEAITDNLVEILFAGYNTNVGTIANCLHFLAKHPKYQESCRREIDYFFESNQLHHFNLETFSRNFKVDNFKTIENVFYETLRLRPPAPLLARQLTKDFEFIVEGGDRILLEKGEEVWIPVEYLHRNKEHWLKYNSEEFHPERFDLRKPCTTGSYLPFSGGPRDCIGKNFAKLEGVMILVMLLHKYEFNEDPEYKYQNKFNGFGYRPFDSNTQKVCMNLIATKRK